MIGPMIAHLRTTCGYSQEELANILGMTRAAISHYESGRREPDIATLILLSDTFGVSIDTLVRDVVQ